MADARSKKVRFFHVDAFAERRFSGNPAAVMPMEEFLEDDLLQDLAAENSLPMTAFLVPGHDNYRIRWFTPTTEVPLCGHATLASAAVVMERLEPGREVVEFESRSGRLTARKRRHRYVLDLPARPTQPIDVFPDLVKALGVDIPEARSGDFDFMAVLDNPSQVRDLDPDLGAIANLDRSGVIVTAPGEGSFDFVSRYFAPADGLPEDPVTGVAHCTLAPYWGQRLGKSVLRARQVSHRGGELICELVGKRVELEGACTFYLEGEAEI